MYVIYNDYRSIQAIIPGLEDLEAKLSAFYSKIEQGKIETKLPSSRRSRSRSRERGRKSRSRSRSRGRGKPSRDLYEGIPPRVVENIPPPPKSVEEIDR